MNNRKLLSGISALSIYLGLIFLILFYYNIHKIKAKNYVDKDSSRVTVTLVNSDKTVFNKSSKKTNSVTPVPILPPVPLKRVGKSESKKIVPKKVVPKKVIKPKKVVPKKVVPKKVIKPKKVVPKKVVPKKVIKPKKVVPKKVVPKKVIKPKKVVPKKVVPKKVIKPKKVVPKKVVPKKSAKDLFSNINTRTIPKKAPVIHTQKRPVIVSKRPTIKHNSSVTDRIKNTHQSGRVSNANRDSGVKNSYIAKVKRHMQNWPASQKGQRISISLTIYNSGKFSYRILSGARGEMSSSLKQYLDRLNRIGLGRHGKSTPYNITVNFTT